MSDQNDHARLPHVCSLDLSKTLFVSLENRGQCKIEQERNTKRFG